ncbi:c-type cytochrome [Pinibacter aurantiacus]|uniref:Cytochrome c n=1 Tax=Pinibacter aurantiacus TaxID=2851599 RepID=A0A9E2W3J9_9BACT|nr:cytochrome c [Pinibacter aurantiacus]MBV4356343.1 cytochrome c [Pinibacter aurantiacus]
MKKTFVYVAFSVALLAAACGGNNQSASKDNTAASEEKKPSENPSYDPKRGEGKFTHVDVAATLDPKMAESGEKVYQLKCSSCHKTTDEKLVGPGWKGVTNRHAAEWIMNFVTNTDEMLNKDPQAQAQLEICLVRMPNQNLSDDDARHVYEFMRKNDGVK